jgi:hypothetical protein
MGLLFAASAIDGNLLALARGESCELKMGAKPLLPEALLR